MNLLSFTDKGIYCTQGDFYIDPWSGVKKAIITHAHSDHARWGSEYYLCHHYTLPLLKLRLGDNNYQSVSWGENIFINGVKVSLHPAGHIIGSSQVRVEYNGEVWVVSGDYKTEDDGLSGSFEVLKCNVFITESTFGLPIYNWKSQQEIFYDIQNWIIKNKKAGKNSMLIAYSLGKAQRLLPCIHAITSEIYVHGAIWNTHEALIKAGIQLPSVKRIMIDMPKDSLKETVIIAPPGSDNSPWIKRFSSYSVGICSGWMQVRGNIRRRNADAGFALSDHADWKGLLEVVSQTNAEKIFVTHGFQSSFSRYLNEKGIDAAEVKTEFGDEEETQTETQSISDIE
ncbi:MAG TPA: ligase-associated DNA damage response exonuclease [Puia sp.]|nr:ligase-associated DNA damage response exonuclease [Puia sp.]